MDDVQAINEQFSEDNIPKSNWMKFDKVGDYIIGTFNSKEVKPGDAVYADQMVYVLTNVIINGEQKPVDEEWNFGVTVRQGRANFVNNKFSKVIPGQRIGLKFQNEIAPKVKGYHPAKSFLPNVFGVDPSFKGKETFNESQGIPIEEIPNLQ